jgi:MFS family permease
VSAISAIWRAPGEGAGLQAQRHSRAALGVMLCFLVHGLVVSTFVSRLPSIKSALRLSDGALGLALLGTAFGSIAGIAATGVLVTRFGSKRMSQWTSVGFCGVLALPALSHDGITLFLGLLAYGALAGANDVAMNAQAVGTERLMEVPFISRFHAMFSAGGIAGAAGGAWMASRGVPVFSHLAFGGMGFAVIALAGRQLMVDPGSTAEKAHVPLKTLFHPSASLLALSAIGFCIFLSEGAMADWTAVYLKQVLHASIGLAPLGYALFSAAMAIFRFRGDAITARIGRVRVVRFGGILATAGIALAVCAPSPVWALAGFAAAGAGYSSIIPLVFAAGGRKGSVSEGQGVATVSGIGYLGFLAGPPAIGFVSEFATLRAGLGVLVLMSAIAAYYARAVE